MVESDRKRFNDRFTCCYYSAILWLEGHLFDADASNNAVSVFIVFYDFASDCTILTQGGNFPFCIKTISYGTVVRLLLAIKQHKHHSFLTLASYQASPPPPEMRRSVIHNVFTYCIKSWVLFDSVWLV
jgi:hypothetical protein